MAGRNKDGEQLMPCFRPFFTRLYTLGPSVARTDRPLDISESIFLLIIKERFIANKDPPLLPRLKFLEYQSRARYSIRGYVSWSVCMGVGEQHEHGHPK